MDITHLLYFLEPYMNENMDKLIEYLRERDIYVCEVCYRPVNNFVMMCQSCLIKDCGCNGDFRCCGYEPYDYLNG